MGYFSKHSVYRWVLTVQRCLSTCFYTRMRRNLYKVSSKQASNSCTTIQFHLQIYRRCIVSEKHKIRRVFGIHLSTWTWNKGNNGDCSFLLILGLLLIYIDNVTTRLYDKRDDFNFPIVNFTYLSCNIPSAPAYGVYVSQLIRYPRACSNYQDFMERGKVLTTKLFSQGCQKTKSGSNA